MKNSPGSETKQIGESKDSSLSRRKVVKALSTVGGVGIVGTPSATARAAPDDLTSVSADRISGNELRRLARKVTKRDDIRKLMDSEMRETVLNGRLIEITLGDQSRWVITRDVSKASRLSNLKHFAEGDVVVAAVRHTLATGNEVTVVAYAAGSDQAIVYYDYDEPHEGTETRARLFDIVGDGTPENTRLVARGSSYDGELSKSPMKFPATSSCEGCQPGPGSTGYTEVEECVEIDTFCAGSCCAACAGAQLCGPAGIYCGIACIATWCLGCLGYCCTGYDINCSPC